MSKKTVAELWENIFVDLDIINKINKDGKESEVFNRRASTVRGWIEWIIGCQV